MDERNNRPPPGETGPAEAAMEDQSADTDFRALAEDWIAIWQSELTAYLTDPETQAKWAAMLALWSEAAQAMLRSMPGQSGFTPWGEAPRPRRPAGHDRASGTRPPSPTPAPGADAAPGPASASAAPDPRDDEVRRLEQRVAELERRLGERDGAGPGAGTRRAGAAGADRRPRRGGRG